MFDEEIYQDKLNKNGSISFKTPPQWMGHIERKIATQ